eukprot:TRINITY_DN4195_c0_g3_i3.p1 TRINITY_DN4195_c0_g3~~TRINITY_DN4195_c0_g3_i3.p1  ORF type:complete len:354 (-),score=104.87 TRINITY_DN4195_c0_g3_i3:90-1052(-)
MGNFKTCEFGMRPSSLLFVSLLICTIYCNEVAAPLGFSQDFLRGYLTGFNGKIHTDSIQLTNAVFDRVQLSSWLGTLAKGQAGINELDEAVMGLLTGFLFVETSLKNSNNEVNDVLEQTKKILADVENYRRLVQRSNANTIGEVKKAALSLNSGDGFNAGYILGKAFSRLIRFSAQHRYAQAFINGLAKESGLYVQSSIFSNLPDSALDPATLSFAFFQWAHPSKPDSVATGLKVLRKLFVDLSITISGYKNEEINHLFDKIIRLLNDPEEVIARIKASGLGNGQEITTLVQKISDNLVVYEMEQAGIKFAQVVRILSQI